MFDVGVWVRTFAEQFKIILQIVLRNICLQVLFQLSNANDEPFEMESFFSLVFLLPLQQGQTFLFD